MTVNFHLLIFWWNQRESEIDKNRTNLWVMTHDFRIFFAKIISFPLRICWKSWFSIEIQILSGNQQFFQLFGAFSHIFGFSGKFQNLSGNEFIFGIISEKKVNFDHEIFKFSAEIWLFWDYFRVFSLKFDWFSVNTFKNKLSENYHAWRRKCKHTSWRKLNEARFVLIICVRDFNYTRTTYNFPTLGKLFVVW